MAIKGSSKKTVKPPEVVRRILRGKLAGQTTAALARAEGIHRDTVLRILTLPEVRERMERARQYVVSEAEPMTRRLVDIAMGHKEGDWRALVETLKGVGVLTTRQEIEIGRRPEELFEGRSYHELMFFGMHLRWPEPDELEDICGEFPMPKGITELKQ
jgi:hypothetical protein